MGDDAALAVTSALPPGVTAVAALPAMGSWPATWCVQITTMSGVSVLTMRGGENLLTRFSVPYTRRFLAYQVAPLGPQPTLSIQGKQPTMPALEPPSVGTPRKRRLRFGHDRYVGDIFRNFERQS